MSKNIKKKPIIMKTKCNKRFDEYKFKAAGQGFRKLSIKSF